MCLRRGRGALGPVFAGLMLRRLAPGFAGLGLRRMPPGSAGPGLRADGLRVLSGLGCGDWPRVLRGLVLGRLARAALPARWELPESGLPLLDAHLRPRVPSIDTTRAGAKDSIWP